MQRGTPERALERNPIAGPAEMLLFQPFESGVRRRDVTQYPRYEIQPFYGVHRMAV
jgi:hypothetical protein